MIKFTHIFPLFCFGRCSPTRCVKFVAVFVLLEVCNVSKFSCNSPFNTHEGIGTSYDVYKGVAGQRAHDVKVSKHLLQDLFFIRLFLVCVGCGVQLKNTSGKKVQTCELLDVRLCFWPGATTPPPQDFYDLYVCLGGQPSNLTVAYFFPMGLVQPPTANSIKAPNAATLRPAYVEAI